MIPRRSFFGLGLFSQQPTVRTLSPQCPVCKQYTYVSPLTAHYPVVSEKPEALVPIVYSCMHVNICANCGTYFLSKRVDETCPGA
jgi:hypothetical protein